MINNIEYLRRNLPIPLADPPVQAPLGYDVESWTSRLLQASAAQVGARAAAHRRVLGTDPGRAPRGSV